MKKAKKSESRNHVVKEEHFDKIAIEASECVRLKIPEYLFAATRDLLQPDTLIYPDGSAFLYSRSDALPFVDSWESDDEPTVVTRGLRRLCERIPETAEYVFFECL